jgi:hypothetical protein
MSTGVGGEPSPTMATVFPGPTGLASFSRPRHRRRCFQTAIESRGLLSQRPRLESANRGSGGGTQQALLPRIPASSRRYTQSRQLGIDCSGVRTLAHAIALRTGTSSERFQKSVCATSMTRKAAKKAAHIPRRGGPLMNQGRPIQRGSPGTARATTSPTAGMAMESASLRVIVSVSAVCSCL